MAAASGSVASLKCFNVAIFGAGVVGGGIIQILAKNAENLARRGIEFKIKTVVCRSPKRERDFEMPEGTVVTSDHDAILSDDSIDLVVEVMGGTTSAKDAVLSSLRSGKQVVTANKALLAEHMEEVLAALEEGKDKGAGLGYEAAVAGGIPVIRSLQDSFACDGVSRVAGILNGTTNFMLTAMAGGTGISYDDILAEAQKRGFAEADPTADVDGLDARAKVCVLARLCFGVTVEPSAVPCGGIRRLTPDDFEYAKMLRSTIKLVGVAGTSAGTGGAGAATGGKSSSESGSVYAYVAPMIVPQDNPLASVGGAANMVLISSESMGVTSLSGQGAGRLPTANSVVSDMVRAAEVRGASASGTSSGLAGAASAFPVEAPAGTVVDSNFRARFYIRLVIKDEVGILRKLGEEAEKTGVSLYSVLQAPITDRARVPFVIVTDAGPADKVEAFCEAIEGMSFLLEKPLKMPFLE